MPIVRSGDGKLLHPIIYDTVLKFAPNDLKTLKRKGLGLEKLSELQLSQQQYTEAIKALKQAIAYDSAFSRYHSDAIDISYHGMMIERLAELYLTNKQYTEAFATYQQAFATYETAIQHLEVADTLRKQ
jgi:tetratricopeptide (TPR) repeat protein